MDMVETSSGAPVTAAVSILLVIIVVGLAGLIALQIFLSKKESKWPGLILPIISFCLSVVVVLGMAGPSYNDTDPIQVIEQTIDENGVVSEAAAPETADAEQGVQETQKTQGILPMAAQVGSVFLLYNIPTIIFMAIYLGSREKRRQRKALEKMLAQDLG